jgi:hypothetical protein
MNKFCALVFFFAVTLGAAAAEDPVATGESKSCTVGPAKKTFGGTKWLLYGCNDATSAVIVSGAGNPAAPFYFFVFREAGNYRIVGEGAGSKAASGAALKELQALSGKALANLVGEAKRAHAGR